MNNPQIILAALERHLVRSTRVILYGRAALSLGYPGAGVELGATMGVDAILPAVELAAIAADDQFWRAVDRVNRELESRGLYMTHLFSDDQLILTPDWFARIVSIPTEGWQHLRVFRPATLDLVLTKMMREDPQDLGDIAFLLRQEPIRPAELRTAFSTAHVPELEEIRAAFAANQPRVLALSSHR